MTRARPRWGALYAIVLVALTVLAAVDAVGASETVTTALRLTVVAGAFAAIAVWTRRQRAAFDLDEWCDCAAQQVTIREIPSSAPAVSEPDLEPAPEEREIVFTRS